MPFDGVSRRSRKKIGLPSFIFSPQEVEIFDGRPLHGLRQLGLEALGFVRITSPAEHYVTWQRGSRQVILSAFGSMYEGDFGPTPVDVADITDAGRANMAQAIADHAAQKARQHKINIATSAWNYYYQARRQALESTVRSHQPAPMRMVRQRRGRKMELAPCHMHPTRFDARYNTRRAWELRANYLAAKANVQ